MVYRKHTYIDKYLDFLTNHLLRTPPSQVNKLEPEKRALKVEDVKSAIREISYQKRVLRFHNPCHLQLYQTPEAVLD